LSSECEASSLYTHLRHTFQPWPHQRPQLQQTVVKPVANKKPNKRKKKRRKSMLNKNPSKELRNTIKRNHEFPYSSILTYHLSFSPTTKQNTKVQPTNPQATTKKRKPTTYQLKPPLNNNPTSPVSYSSTSHRSNTSTIPHKSSKTQTHKQQQKKEIQIIPSLSLSLTLLLSLSLALSSPKT